VRAVVRALAIVAALAGIAHADDATSTKPSGSAPISTNKDDDEGTPKFSLPTEADRVAWTRSGFRLGLGLAYGRMVGLRGAPSGRLLGPNLHAGLRLDRDWSILASFTYESASASGGLSGLRFAGTIDPTWHVTPSFSLAFGFGFGGFVEGRTGRADMAQQAVDTSITFPSASPPVPSCSGVGAAGVARAEYMFVLGPRTNTNVELEVLGQYTGCVDRTGRVDRDTAQPIVRTQYWPHYGATLSWGFAWR
jgi:hypothetical protein